MLPKENCIATTSSNYQQFLQWSFSLALACTQLYQVSLFALVTMPFLVEKTYDTALLLETPTAELVQDGTPQLGGRDVEPFIWVRSAWRQALTHHHRSVNFSILKRNQFGKMHQGSLEWFQSFYLYIYIHTHINNFWPTHFASTYVH